MTQASGNVSWFSVFAMSGTGEVVVDTGIRNLDVQKNFTGPTATLVKKGSGRLTLANETLRDFTAGGVRLEDGSLKFGNLRPHTQETGFDFTFSGNEGSQLVTLTTNLVVNSLVLHEVNGVTNRAHGFTSSGPVVIAHLGGSAAVASSDFSGTLYDKVGIVWRPYSADTELVFRKATHETTGPIVVSNGVVRITEGANFPKVSKVLVEGGTSTLALDDDSVSFPAAEISLVAGGRIVAPAGEAAHVIRLTQNGVAVPAGLYKAVGSAGLGTEADWVLGSGRVIVDHVGSSITASAEWTGAGATTSVSLAENWKDGVVPNLTDGSTVVTVTGGAGMTADVDTWLKGVVLGSQDFTLAATPGKSLWIGDAGISNPNKKAVTVDGSQGPIRVTASEIWATGTGLLTVKGHVETFPGVVLVLAHTAKSPAWTSGTVFDPDLILLDDSKTSKGSTTITVPGNGSLVFNGQVVATNTSSLGVTAQAGSVVTFNKLFMSRDGGTLKGNGRIVFKDSLHFRDRPYIQETVTVELHKDGNRLNGNMGTFSGGTFKCMAPYVITKANTRRQSADTTNNSADGSQNTMINAKGTFVLDLNGFDQSIDQFAMHANGTSSGGHVTSAKPATLHLQTVKSWWAKHNYQYGFSDHTTMEKTADSYGYETADKGYWEDQVTLSYEADAGMVRSMMRMSSSSGNVEVVSGTLVFLRRAKTANETFDLKGGTANPYWRLADEDGAWPNAKEAVVKGGVLKLEHSQAFGRETNVRFEKTGSAYGKLELAEGVHQKCFALSIDGVDQARGTYGATGSGAKYVDDTRFAGTGVLNVLGDGQGLVVIFR